MPANGDQKITGVRFCLNLALEKVIKQVLILINKPALFKKENKNLAG